MPPHALLHPSPTHCIRCPYIICTFTLQLCLLFHTWSPSHATHTLPFVHYIWLHTPFVPSAHTYHTFFYLPCLIPCLFHTHLYSYRTIPCYTHAHHTHYNTHTQCLPPYLYLLHTHISCWTSVAWHAPPPHPTTTPHLPFPPLHVLPLDGRGGGLLPDSASKTTFACAVCLCHFPALLPLPLVGG